MYALLCIFAANHIIYVFVCIYECILLLSMTLFVWHSVTPCAVIKDTACLF